MTKINKVFDKYFDLCETILFLLYPLFSFSFAQFYWWGTASPASSDRTSLVVKFLLRKLGCTLTWRENAVPQLRNCVALQLNQKVLCGSCALLRKLKKLNCAFCAALLLVEKIVALCCAALKWYNVYSTHLWYLKGNLYKILAKLKKV